ncbi:MAG: C40 family peptidase [Bacteroidales bacterium]|nr:C40 family peptidase [Bacteroidales bacterium]
MWGGTSSKAVDCSGFMQSVFFRNGLILSRDASLQALHGDHVSVSEGYSDLQKGDLLFFGTRDEKGDHVTHVALYIGDSEFIHASSRVMINSLDSSRTNFSSFRKNSLLSARRILGAEDDSGIVLVSSHELY